MKKAEAMCRYSQGMEKSFLKSDGWFYLILIRNLTYVAHVSLMSEKTTYGTEYGLNVILEKMKIFLYNYWCGLTESV